MSDCAKEVGYFFPVIVLSAAANSSSGATAKGVFLRLFRVGESHVLHGKDILLRSRCVQVDSPNA